MRMPTARGVTVLTAARPPAGTAPAAWASAASCGVAGQVMGAQRGALGYGEVRVDQPGCLAEHSVSRSVSAGMRLDPPTMMTSSTAPRPLARRRRDPLDDLGGRVEQVAAGRIQVGAGDRHRGLSRAGCATTTSAGRPRAQVLLSRLDVRETRSLSSLLSSRSRRAARGGMQLIQPVEHQVEQPVVDIGAAELVVAVGGEHGHRAVR